MYPDPLVLEPGDSVIVEDRPSEWAGWVWCTAPTGKAGWLPLAFLNRTGDTATANRSYTTAELAVEPGDDITVLESESGWYWARNGLGQLGWVPIENTQP